MSTTSLLCLLIVCTSIVTAAIVDGNRWKEKSDACEARGGVMIKGGSGYICVKLERIPPVS